MKFEKASAVAVGAFNIYIIQPPFFLETGLGNVASTSLPQETAVDQSKDIQLQTNLSRPGFKFRFSGDNFEWTVRPDRVLVESRQDDSNCGDILSKLLQKLPWTPLDAVGINAEFSAPSSELPNIANRWTVQKESTQGLPVKQQGWHVSVEGENGQLVNVILSVTEQKVEIQVNVHTEVKRRLGPQQEKLAFATAACERFFSDLELGKQIASSVFSVNFDKGSN